MGTDLFHCGGLGMGQVMKLTNNLLASVLIAANSEALVSGVKAGLTLETMTSVLRTTMAWNQQFAVAMHNRGLKGDFEPGFMVRLAHKDCRLAMEMNQDLGLSGAGGRRHSEALEEVMDAGMAGTRRRRDPEAARGGGGGNGPAGPMTTSGRAISLHAADDVAMATSTWRRAGPFGCSPVGRQLAATPFPKATSSRARLRRRHEVRKYGDVIGRTTRRSRRATVHVHNLSACAPSARTRRGEDRHRPGSRGGLRAGTMRNRTRRRENTERRRY